MYEIGNCYTLDNYHVMIVGQDDEHDYIYFISIMTSDEYARIQCPFAPVHKDILDDSDLEFYGNSQPSSIIESIKTWKDQGDDVKTFFTVPIPEIWEMLIKTLLSSGAKIQDYYAGQYQDAKYMCCLPIIFPTSMELIENNNNMWKVSELN